MLNWPDPTENSKLRKDLMLQKNNNNKKKQQLWIAFVRSGKWRDHNARMNKAPSLLLESDVITMLEWTKRPAFVRQMMWSQW